MQSISDLVHKCIINIIPGVYIMQNTMVAGNRNGGLGIGMDNQLRLNACMLSPAQPLTGLPNDGMNMS